MNKEEKDYLDYELETPVTFEKATITRVDMTKLRDMTLDELSEVYDAYEAMGGNGNVTLDVPLPFAKLIMQRITGYPLEALGKLSARDGIRLRARIYRFFYLSK